MATKTAGAGRMNSAEFGMQGGDANGGNGCSVQHVVSESHDEDTIAGSNFLIYGLLPRKS
jgi:hypothetical protein